MNAMETMVANILSKALPAEVIALLSPENIQELKNAAANFVVKISQDLETIKEQNIQILASFERLENGPRKSSRSNRGSSGGSSDGNGSD